MLATCCALLHELALNGRLLEESALAVLLKNARALILLFEAAQCAIDGFVLLNNNTYHS